MALTPHHPYYIAAITVFIALAALTIFTFHAYPTRPIPAAYWLWAGIVAADAPANSDLYIYQGLIKTTSSQSHYKRVGLYPHPLQAKAIYLSYRLEGDLPEPEIVTHNFLQSVTEWQRHKLTITGLQVDFDSATSKLLQYGDFLTQLRDALPPQYKLSITGLGDWAVYGQRDAVSHITTTVDEVVYQLYQDHDPLPNMQRYIQALSRYKLPFRIGLLASDMQNNDAYLHTLSANSNFNGVIYFIQK